MKNMVKESIQKMSLHSLVLELLEPKVHISSREYRRNVVTLIHNEILKVGIDWKIETQTILAELTFENDDLMSALRDQYQEINELYQEFERRHQEYKVNKKKIISKKNKSFK